MQVRRYEAIGGYNEAGPLFASGRPLSFEQRDGGRRLFDETRDINLSANDRNRGQADAHERENKPTLGRDTAHSLILLPDSGTCSREACGPGCRSRRLARWPRLCSSLVLNCPSRRIVGSVGISLAATWVQDNVLQIVTVGL